MQKSMVTISRKWHEPKIHMTVDMGDGIDLKMELGDFVEALAAEMGNPTLLVTKFQLVRALKKAQNAVVEGIKEESAKIMSQRH